MKRAILVAVGVILAGGGYAAGQQSVSKAALAREITEKFPLAEGFVEACILGEKLGLKDKVDGLEPAEARQKYLDLIKRTYQATAEEPVILRAVEDHVMRTYYAGRSDAKSAAQASQLADEASLRLRFVEIHQNQRIIELLEQVAKKPSR